MLVIFIHLMQTPAPYSNNMYSSHAGTVPFKLHQIEMEIIPNK